MTQTVRLLTSVAFARELFPDAAEFVQAVACTSCGVTAEEAHGSTAFPHRCEDCNRPGCECVLTSDPHKGDVYWCEDCFQSCGCYYCTGD
jgi:hypothetical protein